jgi:hypothetical protein
MRKLLVLLILGAWATPVVAGEAGAVPTAGVPVAGKNLWRASMVTLAVANAMDVRSSWGKYELNPSLAGSNGKFGREGALIKLGIVSGMFVVESVVLRHKPSKQFYRGLALVNFGSASVTGAMAIRNLGVPRQ